MARSAKLVDLQTQLEEAMDERGETSPDRDRINKFFSKLLFS